jgi:hypothetical protein
MKVDAISFASGVIVAALGTLILLDESGAVDVTLGWIAVALTGAVGAILLLSGLANGSPGRHD